MGPLIAGALVLYVTSDLRVVFLLAAVPAAATLLLLWRAVADLPLPPARLGPRLAGLREPRLRRALIVFFVFTLGNSTDAFLLLRAQQLGVATVMLPFLWSALHASKTLSSFAGGDWSDRFGPQRTIAAGWVIYAAVYPGFAVADAGWHAWALFIAYGLYFGLSEGPEKALIAGLAPDRRMGEAMGGYRGGDRGSSTIRIMS